MKCIQKFSLAQTSRNSFFSSGVSRAIDLAYFKESVRSCLQFSDSFLPEKIKSTNQPHICSLQNRNYKPNGFSQTHSYQSAMMLAGQISHAASDWPPFLQSKKIKKNVNKEKEVEVA